MTSRLVRNLVVLAIFLLLSPFAIAGVSNMEFISELGDGYLKEPIKTSDGGYIVVGNTWLIGRMGQSRIYILKTDDKGKKVWVKTFGGEKSAYGHSVCRTTDGGYIVAGKAEDMDGGDDDIYLIVFFGLVTLGVIVQGLIRWSREPKKEEEQE